MSDATDIIRALCVVATASEPQFLEVYGLYEIEDLTMPSWVLSLRLEELFCRWAQYAEHYFVQYQPLMRCCCFVLVRWDQDNMPVIVRNSMRRVYDAKSLLEGVLVD